MKFFKSKKFKKFIFTIFTVIMVLITFSCVVFADTTNDNNYDDNTNTENHFNNNYGLSFNVWKLYRNSITFALWSDDAILLDKVPVYTNDNTVIKDINGVTTISNEESLLYVVGDHNYINAVSLSVPTTRLEPVFYVNKNYVGLEVRFNVSFTISLEGVDPDTFQWIHSNPMTPIFDLYFGVDKYSYDHHYCKVLSSKLDTFSEKTVTYSYILSTSFDTEGYIVGFWTKFYWQNFGLNLSTNNGAQFTWLNWTLSPISFMFYDDNITAFINAENGVFVGAYEYAANLNQVESLNATFGNQNLRTATLWLTNRLEHLYKGVDFIHVLINVSLCIGIICLCIGIFSNVITGYQRFSNGTSRSSNPKNRN